MKQPESKKLKRKLVLCVNCMPFGRKFVHVSEVFRDAYEAIDKKSLQDPYLKSRVILREAARSMDKNDGCLVVNTSTDLGRETVDILMDKADEVYYGIK